MTFEWDEQKAAAKAAANLAKHGVSFEEAKTVFDDRLYVDIIIGESRPGRLLIVSNAMRRFV